MKDMNRFQLSKRMSHIAFLIDANTSQEGFLLLFTKTAERCIISISYKIPEMQYGAQKLNEKENNRHYYRDYYHISPMAGFGI